MKKVFFAFVAVATLALVSCNNNAPAAEETPATEEVATEEAPAATEEAPAEVVATDSTAAAPAAQ